MGRVPPIFASATTTLTDAKSSIPPSMYWVTGPTSSFYKIVHSKGMLYHTKGKTIGNLMKKG